MTPIDARILGTWSSAESGNPHLEFSEDGRVVGTDGCNGIFTTYRITGDRAALEPFVSTLKACIGVDDWLRGVRAVAIDGDSMRVYDDSGAEIGALTRDAE